MPPFTPEHSYNILYGGVCLNKARTTPFENSTWRHGFLIEAFMIIDIGFRGLIIYTVITYTRDPAYNHKSNYVTIAPVLISMNAADGFRRRRL